MAPPVHLDIITRYSLQQETIADITEEENTQQMCFTKIFWNGAAKFPLSLRHSSAAYLVSFGHEAEKLDKMFLTGGQGFIEFWRFKGKLEGTWER